MRRILKVEEDEIEGRRKRKRKKKRKKKKELMRIQRRWRQIELD